MVGKCVSLQLSNHLFLVFCCFSLFCLFGFCLVFVCFFFSVWERNGIREKNSVKQFQNLQTTISKINP